MRIKWSLSVKLVAASLAVEVVMLSALLVSNTHTMTRYLESQLETRLAEESELFNAALGVPVVQRDFGALQDILGALARQEGIAYLVLVDVRGNVMAARGRDAGAPLPPVSEGEAAKVDGVYHTRIPISLGGQVYGTLHFGVSTTFFVEARRSLLKAGILIAIGEVVLSAVFLSLLGLWLTRRLREVTEASETIAGGALDARVKTNGGEDEIGRLGHSFNVMADTLQARLNDLRESRERFQSLVETTSDWIWEIDRDARFTYASPRAKELLGYDPEQLVGTSGYDLMPPEEAEKISKRFNTYAEKGLPFSGLENVNIRADGRRITLESSGVPFFDEAGNLKGYRGIDRDITERRKTIDALTRSNLELERFAFVASHDLQEPIRILVAYSQMLEKRYGDALDDDARDYIGFMVSSAKRMKALVHDLLAYARVTSHGISFNPTDLSRVMTAVRENLRAAIKESGARIEAGDLPILFADETQLIEVFQNLIGNAIKFRRPGEKPNITVKARKTGSEWEISISDNGIGIEDRFVDQIFQIFKRLHTDQAYPGTGIGLALVKRIVERHGGRIWVESTFGEGSTFLFTLPDSAPGTD